MRIIVPMLTYSLAGIHETSGPGENPSGKELKVVSGQQSARNLGSQSNNHQELSTANDHMNPEQVLL